MNRRAVVAVVVGAACLTATAVGAHFGMRAPAASGGAVWQDAKWTPPIDNWGQGRAYSCNSGACSGGVQLFARTKVGFCNCFSGVADDTEIDRIGDVDLHGDDFSPMAPGHVTQIGDLKGRQRLFEIKNHWSGSKQVLSIVVATDCKAVVATLVSSRPISPVVEQAAIALLQDKPFQQWAASQ